MSKDEFAELLVGRLSEFRARYSGKNPFEPWTDLSRLYESLDDDGRAVLCRLLSERKSDPFWSTFITLFLEQDPSRCGGRL